MDEAPPITDGAFFLSCEQDGSVPSITDEDIAMFWRHAPATLAGRLLHVGRLWWDATRKERRRAAPSVDYLNDHLRRDVGLPPEDRSARDRDGYPANWPWQRF